MPPRKRARVSRAVSPTTTSQPITPTPAESSPDKEDADMLNDPWTDEEEIALFKGLIRCKPTGIHKHFHLMSLHQFLLENGYIHPRNEHTKPAGIWAKLQTLYNLQALDEREDARQLAKVEVDHAEDGSGEEDEDADAYSEAANKIENEDFDLHGAEYEQLKWANRLAGEKQRRDESPPVLPELNLAEAPPVRFTPSFSIEPEVATPRGRGRAGTAASTKSKPAATGGTRRSARQVESVAEDAEEPEEAGDEDEEEEDGEDEPDESERSTPATRSTRSRARSTGQSTARKRGKGR